MRRVALGRLVAITAPWILAGCTDLLPPIVATSTEGSGTEGSGATTGGPSGPTATMSTTTPTTPTTGSGSGDVLDSTGSTGFPPDEGWARRRVITLSAMDSHADVPVRIHLPAEFDVDAMLDPPNDLRLLTPEGQTLPHEVELWDFRPGVEAGAEIWVLVPQVEPGTEIWMEYGHPDPPPSDPGAVWPDALGVWHLAAQQPEDSAQSGVPAGTSMGSQLVKAAVGLGHAYDGNSWDELHSGPGPLGGSAEGTVQLWFSGGMLQASNISALFHGTPDDEADLYGGNQELYLAILQPMTGDRRVVVSGFSPDNGDPDTEPQEATATAHGDWLDQQWHHVVATWENGDMATITVDSPRGDGQSVSMVIDTFTFSEWIRIGHVNPGFGGFDRGFQGTIDEVRLYDFAFSPERAHIESVAQHEDFASIGEPLVLR